MKSRRVSLPMVFAIVLMFVAWLALGWAVRDGETEWEASQLLLVAVVRMLLVAGMAVCGLATGIAFCLRPRQAGAEKPRVGAGAVAALILGLLAAGVAGLGAWDAAWGSGGSGEWTGLGDTVVSVLALTAGVVSLLLALCLRSVPRLLRVPCMGLAVVALGLPFALGPLRKARWKKRSDEIVHAEKIRRAIEQAKAEAGER